MIRPMTELKGKDEQGWQEVCYLIASKLKGTMDAAKKKLKELAEKHKIQLDGEDKGGGGEDDGEDGEDGGEDSGDGK